MPTRYAKSQTDLCKALAEHGIEVTRKTIGDLLRKFKDPADGLPAAPECRDDGRYDVEAWVAFCQARNVKGVDDDSATAGTNPESVMTAKDWKARKERASALKAELDYEKAQGRVVDRAELEKNLTTMLITFRQQLDGLKDRMAHQLSDGMSFKEKRTKAGVEIDKTLRILEACEYLPKVEA